MYIFKRSPLISQYLLILILTIALPAYAQETEDKQLNDFITYALENNPQLKASYNKYRSAEYKIKFTKGLPNPVFQYGHFFKSIETRTGPQENKFGIFQKIPFPGKLGLKGKIQKKQSEILRERYDKLRQKIITRVKNTYYDIFFVDKAIEVTQEEKSILESIESIESRM